MNILIDDLPCTVTVRSQEIPINTDYRTGILFEQALLELGQSDKELMYIVLDLYYGDYLYSLPMDTETITEAVDKALWFYRCGADVAAGQASGGGPSGDDPPFLYDCDGAYIYAAFMEAYHIDLTRDRLHWWQFRALFMALPDQVQFNKIVGYRTMEIPAKMPKEQKKFYQRMKRIHKIPGSAGRVRLEKELEAILAKGGDISGLIK